MGNRVKILLVDDQPDNLLSAEAVLESLGEEVVKTESGTEALRYLLDNDVSVILLDIMMPEMDGFETAMLIRQRERSRHTPIIFLTALGLGEEQILRGYSLGAVDYLVKPFPPEILRSKVGFFVELNRKSEQLRQQAALLETRNQELQRAFAVQRQAGAEIRALNQHLEYRLAELAEVNGELEAFSYSVSHDLRGPLSRIAGFSKALLDFHAGQLDEDGKGHLQRIASAATQTCDLVDDLLNFSRLTRVELKRETVSLSALVRDVAAELESREPDRAAEFVIQDGIEVQGDPGLLHSALLNLMENAWKFTSRRNPARIEFGVGSGMARGVYFVKDNGAGFDMADAKRLFTPFQRLHTTSEFQGTGIGLAIVDRIIRRHGGSVWAEGEPGHGAVFRFTLPAPATAETNVKST
jgi:two-component system sensor histidine kinase/response regulator